MDNSLTNFPTFNISGNHETLYRIVSHSMRVTTLIIKIKLTEVEGNIVRCCKLFINRISTLALMNPTPLPSNILRDPFHLNTKY